MTALMTESMTDQMPQPIFRSPVSLWVMLRCLW